MHGIFKIRSFFPGGLILLAALVSCRPDPDSDLGNNMHPNDRLTAAYDTSFHIEAFSVPDDSIILQNGVWVMLGSSYSNTFGSVTYNLAVQLLMVRTDSEDDEFSTGGIDVVENIDSVVLYLPYAGIFPLHNRMDGHPLTLSVYEIDEELKDGKGFDSAYSSLYQVRYNAARPVAGPVTLNPRPYDTVYDSLSVSHIIKPLSIHMDKEFGRRLLELVQSMPKEDWTEKEKFTEYFNGIYIKCEPVGSERENIVFSVSNLFTEGAMLRVYHDGYLRDEADNEYYTPYQSFILGPVRFTQAVRDRSVSTDEYFKAQLNVSPEMTCSENGDTVSGGQRLFVEGSGGSRIRFKLPNFADALRDSTGAVKKVILNQALIVLTDAEKDDYADINPPKQLVCFKYVNRGEEGNMLTESNAGGYYSRSAGEYRINITRYLQDILYKGTVDPANYDEFNSWIDIAPASDERYEEPCRVALYGPKAGGRKAMHLEVIYTVEKD